MNTSERSQVLLVGDHVIDEQLFVRRRLTPKHVDLAQLKDIVLLNESRGVCLFPAPGKFRLISEYFQTSFEETSNLGLMTAIYAPELTVQVVSIRNATYRRLKLFEGISDPKAREHRFDELPWVFVGTSDWEIAETLARYYPGPPLGKPELDQSQLVDGISPEGEALLKRAFYDCQRITLKRLSGGRIAKETLRVLANRSDAQYGPQPMPFFVKVGDPEEIEGEKTNYREYAEPFIPFHLRPSLNESRSVNSPKAAALVCNFVENAIPLRDALRSGQGDGVIFSLFEGTLRGIRSHTLNGPKKSGVIEAFFDPSAGRVKAHEIERDHPARIERARSYGVTRKPTEIASILRNLGKNIRTCEGLYHGDPHPGNIMVRNRDAIVIDFGSMRWFGPLSADPAILEVSLVFGTDNHDDPDCFETWSQFIDTIFHDALRPPLTTGAYPQFAWMHKAIRELRHVVTCCGVENNEALIILAGCLLRFARFSPLRLNSKELDGLAERRRGYALVVADRICSSLEKKHVASR